MGPNDLIPINNDYSLVDNKCAFGDLSKTNIFIGENNSGKSRFLRCLFKEGFFYIDSENIEKMYCEYKRYFKQLKVFNDRESLLKFSFIYESIKNNNLTYYTDATEFTKKLPKYILKSDNFKKFYFPTVRGVKDYKTILDRKLRDFSKSVKSIQNKDSINHYISLLNLDETGLEAFDIYREITIREYFPGSSPNILTGGTLYKKIKSMLLKAPFDYYDCPSYAFVFTSKDAREFPQEWLPAEPTAALLKSIEDDDKLSDSDKRGHINVVKSSYWLHSRDDWNELRLCRVKLNDSGVWEIDIKNKVTNDSFPSGVRPVIMVNRMFLAQQVLTKIDV